MKAEKVTITAKPDKGYEVESVIVTDKNGNEVKVTDNGNGTYSFRQPSSKVTIEVNFVKEAAKVEAPVKANPETGASDFVGAAVALAACSAVCGAALMLKRK